MPEQYPEFKYYPSPEKVDQIVEAMWADVAAIPYKVTLLDQQGFDYPLSMAHMHGFSYVRFEPQGMHPFYAYWQPAPSQPAPLLVHTPGYGARIQAHPDLVAQGYNVLHVNPLGYATPQGADEALRAGESWPVFATHLFEGFEVGYRPWFLNVMQAVSWAQEQDAVLPDRLAFFGTSQGGGASLLLGSIYYDRGVRCVAADEPWLVHFPLARDLRPDWVDEATSAGLTALSAEVLWARLGIIDAMAHAYRLTCPVLLTAGTEDTTCPPQTIAALYDHLPGTRSLTYLHGQSHGFTREFPVLAAAWFRLYV